MIQHIQVPVLLAYNFTTKQKGHDHAGRKLIPLGWFQERPLTLDRFISGKLKELEWLGSQRWNEGCKVLDSSDELPLPETLYVVVQCCDESWWASEAFISEEKADNYAREREKKCRWHWVVKTQMIK